MTHVCCPACRLRFGPAPGERFDTCPKCGAPPRRLPAARALGFSFFEPVTVPSALLEAIAAVAVTGQRLKPPRAQGS
jgi:hypothetical protein